MSLNRLKETLRPCSNFSASSSATTAAGASHASSSSTQFPPSRKPPKSSLSQQLQRLDPQSLSEGLLFRAPDLARIRVQEEKDVDDDGEEEGGGVAATARFNSDAFLTQSVAFEARGPYEPLALSSPGETPVVQVPASINCRLLEHQRDGIRFLYNLYKNNHGGVLGDDMGLGKTIQTIAFLAAVIGKDGEHGVHGMEHVIKKGPTLIICPTSVIHNWENEFSEWGDFRVVVYHGPNRDLIIEKLESHGTWEHFRDFYDEPLKHGQRLSAPERYVQIADERKQHLVAVLQKYLLRRTKEETIGHLMLGKEDNVVFCGMSELQKRVYKRMLEQPDVQCLINKDLLCSCGSPLAQVECCKKIVPNGIIWTYLHRDNPEGCESCPFCLVLPCLIKLQQISNHLELIKPNPKDDLEKQKKDAELVSAVLGADVDLIGGNAQTESFMGLSDVEHCGKMRALEKLLLSWTTGGDKILLFSYSVRMLDILEKFLIRKGYCFSRLDGSTPMSIRQSLVDDFNKSPSKQVFLISTRAGGLGLNLVSANRVVIFDPNWNPAQDLQAQDRSFRYGQKRHVIVFRLLAAGSLEELVYSRQIYKQQLSNIAVSGKMEKRYFQGVQDCKEFQGELFGICNLFRDLSDKLFTSEIIEMHEKKGKYLATQMNPLDTESENYITPMEASEISFHGKSNEAAIFEDEKKLQELGILYAHRNENVVNMGPGILGQKVAGTHENFSGKTLSKTRGNSSERIYNMGRLTSEQQKRNEFRSIAHNMGMEELEFSKWLLSASPSQRIEVLQNYKKKKKQMMRSLRLPKDNREFRVTQPSAND
ncbi:SNF2 family N-terminal domain [Musa troglodytarum]|uniref:SNF2 family N-terminal domain n=1 Tax=Musa troglodytarum TaxID=320322 RepID=A0A9E7GRU2_9LILI|nr:SNF2 family N-terminal domain [Musa troglodytarum]